MATETLIGLFAGATALGLLHGAEPGHGWPVAAAWALARRARWRAGVLAAAVIGLGHLVSSVAVVLVFFAAKTWLELGATTWIDWVAGGLLLVLAGWQLRSALRSGHGHPHRHGDHGQRSGHDGEPSAAAGLGALAAFAFALGFAHEEEFQIIALCAGSEHCLGLILTYAVAVVAALVVLTLVLIAGMAQFRHRLEHAQRSLTCLSATILGAMGIGFLAGVF